MVEISKEGCSACGYNGKIFDAISIKFDEMKIDLDLVRMDIENFVPFLGKFKYSPIYFYVRKEDNKIIEIYTLPTPSTTGNNLKDFIEKI